MVLRNNKTVAVQHGVAPHGTVSHMSASSWCCTTWHYRKHVSVLWCCTTWYYRKHVSVLTTWHCRKHVSAVSTLYYSSTSSCCHCLYLQTCWTSCKNSWRCILSWLIATSSSRVNHMLGTMFRLCLTVSGKRRRTVRGGPSTSRDWPLATVLLTQVRRCLACA
jgi:hypothetical protein